MGQYSSPPHVCLPLTVNFGPFQEIKLRELYFCKPSVVFFHLSWLYNRWSDTLLHSDTYYTGHLPQMFEYPLTSHIRDISSYHYLKSLPKIFQRMASVG